MVPSCKLSLANQWGMWAYGCQTFLEFLLCTQVVGNLLYYRFLNPAVVAPDAFDIVAMAAGSSLAAPQRHALGAVAQLLQHAAAGKVFSGESRHLRILNGYLEDLHHKFRSWVLSPYSSLDLSPRPMVHLKKGRPEAQGLWEVSGGSRKPPRGQRGASVGWLGWHTESRQSRAGAKASLRTDLPWMATIEVVSVLVPSLWTGSSSAEHAGYQSPRSASP